MSKSDLHSPAETAGAFSPKLPTANPVRPDDTILTVEQVAADLSISRRTLYDWVHKGIIEPPQKLGVRRVGYRRSAIERFKSARPLAFVPRR